MPSPITRHHAEWLSLLEISGPFLSMPVLLNAFPQGLDDYPPAEARSLRADYEFWQESPQDPAVHTAWIRLVLEAMLGYTEQVLLAGQAIPASWRAEFPEHEETLRPDFMLVEPGTHTPHLLIQVFPPNQSLEKALSGSHWQASIVTRMMELLHATEVRLGLVTNGEQWMLVDAPRGETTGFTTWYAGMWFDEPVTLRAFRSLLGVQRFFGMAADQTLESLLAASAQDQQEITDQLGLQVRHAVEILIQMIDRADQDSGGKLLGKDVPPTLLYEAALTFMMRLVFMLAAEERKLLPLDDSLYAEYYAVSTLRAQLRELADQQTEAVLERRYDAWSRLLAVFRAVHDGIHHERLTLPPYGGSLFDPDKYPFLEGRSPTPSYTDGRRDAPLPVDNCTVLHLLDALQMLKIGDEARRLSFRALDVEQIGHVYEGLLDHTAVRTSEPVVGLHGAKRQEPEITLSALEQASKKKETDFLDWLKDQTGRSPSALKNSLASDILHEDAEFTSHLQAVAGNDAQLLARLAPFAGLMRTDDFGNPVVILPGSVYVTQGTTRRATGTHYTPRSLTEPIVQHTLEPLVYVGPAEGLPREQWRLRKSAELLDLKVCDMAMGSAGFLVQADRYLAERLVEAWDQYGERPELDIGLTDEDRQILARRLVAERCLYGVDKNPLAVEIAKLSLWLATLAKDLPFTFLDHALKCGDSLVGTSEDEFLRWAHGYQASSATLFDEQLQGQLETARQKRRELEGFMVRDVQDAERKAELLKEAETAMAHVKRGADLLTGTRLLGLKAQEIEDMQINLLFPYMAGKLDGEIDPAKHPDAAHALAAVRKEHAFHWELEFPEVFVKGGFSAFVGNPPFLGGTRISTIYGDNYSAGLRYFFTTFFGRADFCSLFFLKAYSHLHPMGTFGLIATDTIAQGDTRETGLDEILLNGGIIFHANVSQPWPGQANVYVSVIHVAKKKYGGLVSLNGTIVSRINSSLNDDVEEIKPKRLVNNIELSYNGSKLDGIGFVILREEAHHLINTNPENSKVVLPYLSGDDVSSRPDQSPSRWVINFFDWDLSQAANYPECLEIVRERVYLQRQKHSEKRTREHWWQFQRLRPELYQKICCLNRVLVTAIVSKYVNFVFVPTNITFMHKVGVFIFDRYQYFSLLQSSMHNEWVWKYSSTMGLGINYSSTDCFETFPFPKNLSGPEQIGETYYETRRQIMLAHQEGLTATYNRFHNPHEKSTDIAHLRMLHVEMDNAVAAAYGWQDLDLGHGFHKTAQGVRYTISDTARREVLARLLKLNHERYEEDVKAGLHEKKTAKETKGAKKKGRKVKEEKGQYELF